MTESLKLHSKLLSLIYILLLFLIVYAKPPYWRVSLQMIFVSYN